MGEEAALAITWSARGRSKKKAAHSQVAASTRLSGAVRAGLPAAVPLRVCIEGFRAPGGFELHAGTAAEGWNEPRPHAAPSAVHLNLSSNSKIEIGESGAGRNSQGPALQMWAWEPGGCQRVTEASQAPAVSHGAVGQGAWGACSRVIITPHDGGCRLL